MVVFKHRFVFSVVSERGCWVIWSCLPDAVRYWTLWLVRIGKCPSMAVLRSVLPLVKSCDPFRHCACGISDYSYPCPYVAWEACLRYQSTSWWRRLLRSFVWCMELLTSPLGREFPSNWPKIGVGMKNGCVQPFDKAALKTGHSCVQQMLNGYNYVTQLANQPTVH